ncbi:uncharacterized protein LOC129918648 [Episyrphus balteatus]|uniref:uncharacterized protein LOC129918648 n=1 Tax=Episyrphus balteatus TaxID=286459 RepID=UPI00248616D8|nr:uncharacterized protein LOC129918648 [Episyrphus balteatus]
MNPSNQKATVAELDDSLEMTPELIAELQFLLPYIWNESSESESRSPNDSESSDKSVEANDSSANQEALLAALLAFDKPLPPFTKDIGFMRDVIDTMRKIKTEEQRRDFKEWVVAEAQMVHNANQQDAGGESESPVPLASSSFDGVDDALGKLILFT